MWTLQNVKCEPPNHAFTYKMFQGENVSSSKGKVVVEVKTVAADVHVVDINVIIRSRLTED